MRLARCHSTSARSVTPWQATVSSASGVGGQQTGKTSFAGDGSCDRYVDAINIFVQHIDILTLMIVLLIIKILEKYY